MTALKTVQVLSVWFWFVFPTLFSSVVNSSLIIWSPNSEVQVNVENECKKLEKAGVFKCEGNV